MKMKNYEKLTIPKDSAWDRKGIFPFIWRNTHWRLKEFIRGVKNIFRWVPTLYRDRDWDHSYILTILQKKIEFQRKEIIYANRHTQVDRDNRDMTIVLNLIERVRDEYYANEYFDYSETKLMFEPIDDKPKLYRLEIDVLSENYDEYLSKYPSSVRKVIKEYPNLEKHKLCFYVAQHNHKKANDLLFMILKERMGYWWD